MSNNYSVHFETHCKNRVACALPHMKMPSEDPVEELVHVLGATAADQNTKKSELTHIV